MSTPIVQLKRNAFGHLVFTDAGGEMHEGVVPVRAFAIGAPDSGIALVDSEGHELVWLDSLDQLQTDIATLISEELSSREFVPIIKCIHSVSSFACPSTWTIDTDRGETTLVLKGEEDIRRLGDKKLLIADTHGIQYLIRDQGTLDRTSRKILDRFL